MGYVHFPNLKRVVFGGYGEPLTHPNLVEMVAQVSGLGVGVTLITNGLLLKRELTEALIKAGVDTLVVSLDSMHLQAYQQAGLKSGLDRVLDNLQELRDLIHDSGFKLPALGIEFVATQSNLAEVYKLPELAKELGASFVMVNNLASTTRPSWRKRCSTIATSSSSWAAAGGWPRRLGQVGLAAGAAHEVGCGAQVPFHR